MNIAIIHLIYECVFIDEFCIWELNVMKETQDLPTRVEEIPKEKIIKWGEHDIYI